MKVAWYAKNPARGRAYHEKYRKRLREAVLALLGGKCKTCGFSDHRALQVDHIKGNGAEENRRFGHPGLYRKILRMLHPEEDYQLLCANCNWIKRVENEEC